ncbi:hypothetical protein Syun_009801 [Stephania yunnanensis]|uniref:Uncharacterized protein n=1 Tax=Stephania yunnanensis TaxID=152371 RepID=A0AAP0PPD6_9MAGN
MGRTKSQAKRSPIIERGARGCKAGDGSTAASQVEAAIIERKRSTSSNRKKKVVENNPIPKHKLVKQANENELRLMETSVDDGGATSSVRDRGVLTAKVETRGDTELSRTPSGDATTIMANVADVEGG